jgi:glutathione S-transferase
MKIYGDINSGNCLKVKWVCDRLALPYTWIDIDTRKRESRTPQFLRLNSAGQVPVIEFDDGRALAQSNAIIRYLARGSDLIPANAFAAAKMDEWLFWEQYSHEPYIDGASARRDAVPHRRQRLPRRHLAAGLYQAGT